MLDDYVIATSAGVIVAAVVILATLLSRYNKLVQEADKSTRLAKDVWDSVSSRFSVMDTRIIDLMARTEVLSARLPMPQATQPRSASNTLISATKPPEVPRMIAPPSRAGEGTETEAKVLRLLIGGLGTLPKSKKNSVNLGSTRLD